MKRFILASASPRRREILTNAGYDFEVVASDADESLSTALGASETVAELSRRKAHSVSASFPGAVVLGCDTVVSLDGEILGKPENEEQAFSMLGKLSGRVHEVYSGVCITDGKQDYSFVCSTQVEFYPLSKETVLSYIATGEPMDKAGAYGIQGYGSMLVKRINGDYFTVMGLPVNECARALAKLGVNSKLKI